MNALIAGSGKKFEIQNTTKYDLVIAADGGIHILLDNKIIPDILIGDMDSIDEDLLNNLPKKIDLIRYPSEKDFTDLELALQYAMLKGCSEIILVGITGIRIDHVLNNINMAYNYFSKGIFVKLIDDFNIMFFLKKGKYNLKVPSKYKYLSLLPWRNDSFINKLEGVKYPLKDTLLKFGTGHGVSNECVGNDFYVEISSGELLVVYSFEK